LGKSRYNDGLGYSETEWHRAKQKTATRLAQIARYRGEPARLLEQGSGSGTFAGPITIGKGLVWASRRA
jgi:hypothetical protein